MFMRYLKPSHTTALIAAFALAGMLTAGCQNSNKTKTALPSDSPKVMVVHVGQTFKIWAKSNPTTGFEWQLATPLNPALLQMEETGFQAPPPRDGLPLVGAPGSQWWELKALKPGDAVMQIAYRRSWERDQPPAEARTYQIKIEP